MTEKDKKDKKEEKELNIEELDKVTGGGYWDAIKNGAQSVWNNTIAVDDKKNQP